MKRARSDSLQKDYGLDYSRAKPNRFSRRVCDDRVTVALDPDVSRVFRRPEDVNGILRALIDKMPRRAKSGSKAG